MKTRDIILMSLFIALISVGAYIKIPIPVCPFTLQFLFTTLAGMCLGGKKGTISVMCYVLLGLLGVPVFAGGGGIGYVFQPTFGYLLGFCVGTFLTGTIANAGVLPIQRRFEVAAFAGLLAVYAIGMCYYWLISRFYLNNPIGMAPLFLYCFILAVPGDLVLCVISGMMAKRLVPALRRTNLYE